MWGLQRFPDVAPDYTYAKKKSFTVTCITAQILQWVLQEFAHSHRFISTNAYRINTFKVFYETPTPNAINSSKTIIKDLMYLLEFQGRNFLSSHELLLPMILTMKIKSLLAASLRRTQIGYNWKRKYFIPTIILHVLLLYGLWEVV
jgi:hypothetical protein